MTGVQTCALPISHTLNARLVDPFERKTFDCWVHKGLPAQLQCCSVSPSVAMEVGEAVLMNQGWVWVVAVEMFCVQASLGCRTKLFKLCNS